MDVPWESTGRQVVVLVLTHDISLMDKQSLPTRVVSFNTCKQTKNCQIKMMSIVCCNESRIKAASAVVAPAAKATTLPRASTLEQLVAFAAQTMLLLFELALTLTLTFVLALASDGFNIGVNIDINIDINISTNTKSLALLFVIVIVIATSIGIDITVAAQLLSLTEVLVLATVSHGSSNNVDN